MMDIVEANSGQDNVNINGDMKLITIKSPAGLDADRYLWPLKKPNAQHIVAQIRLICEDIQALKPLIDYKLFATKDNIWTYEKLSSLCDTYNKAIESLLLKEQQTGIACQLSAKASKEMIKHIIDEVYSTVVTKPDELNRYKPFSPAVYGETSYDLVFQMIDQIGITENDIFIDLGSGVGNVVLQMAASLTCRKCIGVEKEDKPAGYAQEMDLQFRRRMEWYGKKYGDYELIHADFLDSEIRQKILDSSIIFVNNYVFGASLNFKLNQIFKETRNETKIVSSALFCKLNLKMNARNLVDTGSIMHVAELKPECSSVSWTDNPVSYYFHVIDSTKLDSYFANDEVYNKAENIMKHAKDRSTAKEMMLKFFGLKTEPEVILSKKLEVERKTEESAMNKLKDQVCEPINSFDCSDVLKVLITGTFLQLKEEIELLETQMEEYIKQKTQDIMLRTKGHRNSLNIRNYSLSSVAPFHQNDGALINKIKIFRTVQKVVESQSSPNKTESEKMRKSIMVTQILLQQIEPELQGKKLQTQTPTKRRYLRDVNGKWRELSPDIVEGHKYYSKMNDDGEKRKTNVRRKLRKEMNRRPMAHHHSLLSKNASRKQQEQQQQRAAAVHRMILHKNTPLKKQTYCDLIGRRELKVSIQNLKWTNYVPS